MDGMPTLWTIHGVAYRELQALDRPIPITSRSILRTRITGSESPGVFESRPKGKNRVMAVSCHDVEVVIVNLAETKC